MIQFADNREEAVPLIYLGTGLPEDKKASLVAKVTGRVVEVIRDRPAREPMTEGERIWADLKERVTKPYCPYQCTK